jgi:hypothetical protein
LVFFAVTGSRRLCAGEGSDHGYEDGSNLYALDISKPFGLACHKFDGDLYIKGSSGTNSMTAEMGEIEVYEALFQESPCSGCYSREFEEHWRKEDVYLSAGIIQTGLEKSIYFENFMMWRGGLSR